MMMETVIAVFDTIPDARYAVDALLLRKYDRSDISILAEDLAAIREGPVPVGQVLAGALGALAALGAQAIPYLGPLVATGPMLTTLSNLGEDEVDDEQWLARALARVGVPAADARKYADAVRDGRALVLVRAREVVADDIAALLADCGAVDPDQPRRVEPPAA